MPRTLVLGTHNRKKGLELAVLLEPHGFELRTLSEFENPIEVAETGDSFAANAALKATCQARHLGEWVLGEDSGLVVDALGGAPGIYSARYAGEEADDERNNDKLLQELAEVPLEKRTARFVCHATLSDPDGRVCAESEAACRGRIRFERSGGGGFGYDPLFEIREYHRTFGELGSCTKAVLSHRSRAMRQLIPQLMALANGDQWRVPERVR